MFRQPDLQDERWLDCLLQGAGATGFAAVLWLAWWTVAGATADASGSQPSGGRSAARLASVHAELAAIEKQSAAAALRVQEGRRRIPPEPGESDFIREIMEVAKSAGVAIKDYRPEPAVVISGCRQLPIHLSGSADYGGICRFLDRLHRMPRLATVERLEINTAAGSTAYPVAVTLGVYFTGAAPVESKKGAGKNG